MDAYHSQDEVRSTDGWARRICRSVSDAAAAAAAAVPGNRRNVSSLC